MSDFDHPDREPSVRWDRTVCPPGWAGFTRQVGDEMIFACGGCEMVDVCAHNDRCVRELDNKRMGLPQRLGLCPDHAEEFYYPLHEDEQPTCPTCSLTMAVYKRVKR